MCSISEMVQDRTTEVAYALSIGTKINDLEQPIRTFAEKMPFMKPTRKI